MDRLSQVLLEKDGENKIIREQLDKCQKENFKLKNDLTQKDQVEKLNIESLKCQHAKDLEKKSVEINFLVKKLRKSFLFLFSLKNFVFTL